MSSSKSLLVIPTYNEAGNIAAFLETLLALPSGDFDILIVDDSSPDGTGALVTGLQSRHLRLNLLTRTKKDGLAAAYVAGFRWGIEHGFEQLVEMDADFSHRPTYVLPLLTALEDADLVIGTRFMPGGGTEGWSLVRKIISFGGNCYARLVLGLRYRDLTGGFNFWKASALRAIDFATIESRGYAFQIELKYRAHRAGLIIKEMPIVFDERRAGKSKMSGSIFFEAILRLWKIRKWTATLSLLTAAAPAILHE